MDEFVTKSGQGQSVKSGYIMYEEACDWLLVLGGNCHRLRSPHREPQTDWRDHFNPRATKNKGRAIYM